MELVTRKDFVDRLQKDWGHFIQHYNALKPDIQRAYLKKQEYIRLGDLLAHILAWWMDGQQIVEELRGNPLRPLDNYDVDKFNARAVEKFSDVDEETMVQMFEAQRGVMLDLVTRLSDHELEQKNVNTRLYYEIMTHWQEHDFA